ncbi:unnamed protein product, partial [Ectocarpus sp. 8 AP-2014]
VRWVCCGVSGASMDFGRHRGGRQLHFKPVQVAPCYLRMHGHVGKAERASGGRALGDPRVFAVEGVRQESGLRLQGLGGA